jgi:hypothetical protein
MVARRSIERRSSALESWRIARRSETDSKDILRSRVMCGWWMVSCDIQMPNDDLACHGSECHERNADELKDRGPSANFVEMAFGNATAIESSPISLPSSAISD